ncbi:hypothetical protein [Arthrobacter bambusae]|uniref:Uncharacterized protein n=1 Tax=Arthrobacter bambusae TaxID=1338426 RepID=A0AAW8DC58_9MICC|nr:hypothetical protein [Arthrobacter bambusae]MDP9903197.1 hypothetical protein [Arthrobacter bambusae]MDQ0128809.1 hypothetical protein [Arthrobacter bambusae]MDQ0180150.1 hypothetical protein [Arthrobacter bambusae]
MSSIEPTAPSDLEDLGENYEGPRTEITHSNALGLVPGGEVTLPRQWVAVPAEGESSVSTPSPGKPGSVFRPNVKTREEQTVRRAPTQENAPSKQLPIKQLIQPPARLSRQAGTKRAEPSPEKKSEPQLQPSEMSFDDRLREDRRVRKEAAEKAGGKSLSSRLLEGFATGAKQARSQGAAQGPQLSAEDQLRLEGMTLAFAAMLGREINPAEKELFSRALQSRSEGFAASVRQQMGWELSSREEIFQMMNGEAPPVVVSSGAVRAARTVIQANVDNGFGQISRAISNGATVQLKDENGEWYQLPLSSAVSELLSDAEISADGVEFNDAEIVTNNQIVAGGELGRVSRDTQSRNSPGPHPQAAEVYRRFPELRPGAGVSAVEAPPEYERV